MLKSDANFIPYIIITVLFPQPLTHAPPYKTKNFHKLLDGGENVLGKSKWGKENMVKKACAIKTMFMYIHLIMLKNE
jgi:hypothetical protein